tara:strand:- start:90 stop:260 length:171 start_codon:yes stop_codon:yes gene_type:complete
MGAITRLWGEEKSGSLAEYLVTVALIAVACVGVVTAIAGHVGSMLETAGSHLAQGG